MASSFNGTDYFGSGPHRFILARSGRYILGPFRSFNGTQQNVDTGKADIVIYQTGRLTASTVTNLWTLLDAIRAAADVGMTATLIDHHARSWTGMKLAWVQVTSPIDRGRTTSVGYTIFYFKNQ